MGNQLFSHAPVLLQPKPVPEGGVCALWLQCAKGALRGPLYEGFDCNKTERRKTTRYVPVIQDLSEKKSEGTVRCARGAHTSRAAEKKLALSYP